MSKHTPGPWAVNFTKFKEVRASNGALVATCNKLNGLVNLQANARLIAAAPDLLESLEFLVAGIESSVSETFIPLVKARAAIAKATGETK